MMPISRLDYQVLETLHQGNRTVLYRAVNAAGDRCVLKLLNSEYPTPEQTASLKHEYHLIADLSLVNVVQAQRWESVGHQGILVLEDFGGRSLQQFLAAGLSLEIKLRIALQIAQALVSLHHHQIIHKDIKPANIIFNPQTGVAKLTDFSIATQLGQETQLPVNPQQLEGTLAYLSPEQTGRMNRTIDYRTDFYSLGVTLYELFGGELPFSDSDPLALIHSHIAKIPQPLTQLNPALPAVIAAIVAKLLNKNAEDRYQSAAGIVADLERCLGDYQETGEIEAFEVGQRDRQAQLQIPQALYGRETAIQTLQQAFASADRGNFEVVVIAGASGTGKTAVVKELYKSLAGSPGYFLFGKFDQFDRSAPLMAVVESYRGLVRQILTETPERIERWRSRFLAGLGDRGQIMIDLLPELELIIGSQPELLEVDAGEAQQRFMQTVSQFFEAASSGDELIIDFMDDLQWADSVSIGSLPEFINNPQIRRHLLIVAYRDQEVDRRHPLTAALEQAQTLSKKLHKIQLQPLNQTEVTQWVADTLQTEVPLAQPLAQLLHDKTLGNPFFLTQLVKSLYRQNLLQFDYQMASWQWDLAVIQRQAITDNIVDLMIHQLQQLPAETQIVLQRAACIGHEFDLNTLATVSQRSPQATCQTLWSAVEQGLILPLDKKYQLVLHQVMEEEANPRFEFLHDRVQQAAYELIPEAQLGTVRWQIGQLLLQQSSTVEQEERIFEIVGHLNAGLAERELTNSQRLQLIQFNYQAAQRAKRAMALDMALAYVRSAIALTQPADWAQTYDQTLKIQTLGTEMAALIGDRAQMESWAETAIAQSVVVSDRTTVQIIRIRAQINAGELLPALEIARLALRDLGFELPETATDESIGVLMQQTMERMAQIELDDLLALPMMDDAQELAIVTILSNIMALTYQCAPSLVAWTILIQMQKILTFGQFAEGGYICISYGYLVCALLKDLQQAYRIGQIGQKIVMRSNSQDLIAKANLTLAGLINHHIQPLSQTLDLLMEGYQAGLAAGNFEFAAYNASQCILHQYFSGRHLPEVLRQLSDLTNRLRRCDSSLLAIHHQGILPWLELSPASGFTKLLPQFMQQNRFLEVVIIQSYKLAEHYGFGEYETAMEILQEIRPLLPLLGRPYVVTVVDCYAALIALASYQDASTAIQSDLMAIVEYHQAELAFAANHAPMNNAHKLRLVEAERAWVCGQVPEAMQAYQAAIELAQTHGFLQEEALSCERAALFYESLQQPRIAQMYRQDAYRAYVVWGATRKVKALETQYPELRMSNHSLAQATTTHTSHPSTKNLQQSLDLTTVIQASQALSGEIVLERLVEKLLQLVRENAGAQRVVFLQNQAGQLYVKALLDDAIVQVWEDDLRSIEVYDQVPRSLLQYSQRLQKPVLLDEAGIYTQFSADVYLQTVNPLSVLAFPILHQGALFGLLYLENRVARHAFTDDRWEVLAIIAAQAAISLENAQLYRTLESRVEQRTAELSQTLKELQDTQIKLIRSEKMSSLGQLVAGIAHEINNPMNFIKGNLIHAAVYSQDLLKLAYGYQRQSNPEAMQALIESIDLDYLSQDFPQVLESMQVGANRVTDIVQGLRDFARLDESESKTIDIHTGLESTITVLGSQLQSIEIIRHYGDLPLVECFAAELNQVFLNLLTNAIDAVSPVERPQILIQTAAIDAAQVQIYIQDNGVGMTLELQAKIFDPFFTTKPVGQGTGMGLAICHQVITQQHRGKLKCISQPQVGTTLEIRLPIALGRKVGTVVPSEAVNLS
jgi:histidine kinase